MIFEFTSDLLASASPDAAVAFFSFDAESHMGMLS